VQSLATVSAVGGRRRGGGERWAGRRAPGRETCVVQRFSAVGGAVGRHGSTGRRTRRMRRFLGVGGAPLRETGGCGGFSGVRAPRRPAGQRRAASARRTWRTTRSSRVVPTKRP